MSPEVSPTDPDQTCTDDSSHISVSKLNGNTISTPRKLATVRKIDGWTLFSKNLVLYTIEGWTVLLKKSKGFRVGEFVLFVEVDSFMPATDPATKEIFAEAGDPVVFDGENGYRARTQTFAYGERGPRVLSQGHIFKLEDFPKIQSDIRRIQNEAGNDTQSFLKRVRQIDYSSLLGIRKFENGNKGPGGALGKIPYFIPKTDMERVQNCPNLFIKPKYREMVYQESMKMDGTSMTVYFVANSSKYFANLNRLPLKGGSRPAYAKGRFGVCSKNLDLNNVQKNHYWDTALREDLHTKLSTFGQSIAVQGELVGWNIQGNRHQCPKGTYHFYVFSIWDIELQKRWPPTAVETWARAQGLKHVPVLGYVTIPKIARDHQDLLTRANLKLGEGMVFKSCADGRWFKVLSNRYILKHEEGQDTTNKSTLAYGRSTEPIPPTGCWQMCDEEVKEMFEDYNRLLKMEAEGSKGGNRTEDVEGRVTEPNSNDNGKDVKVETTTTDEKSMDGGRDHSEDVTGMGNYTQEAVATGLGQIQEELLALIRWLSEKGTSGDQSNKKSEETKQAEDMALHQNELKNAQKEGKDVKRRRRGRGSQKKQKQRDGSAMSSNDHGGHPKHDDVRVNESKSEEPSAAKLRETLKWLGI